MKNTKQKDIFNQIYKNNSWNDTESVSGSGSRLNNTKNLRKDLIYFIDHDDESNGLNKMSLYKLKNIKCYINNYKNSRRKYV